MSAEKLLSCPFCGGKAVLHESRNWIGLYSVYCSQCGATVGDEGSVSCNEGTTREEAVALWNRRAGCERAHQYLLDVVRYWQRSDGVIDTMALRDIAEAVEYLAEHGLVEIIDEFSDRWLLAKEK